MYLTTKEKKTKKKKKEELTMAISGKAAQFSSILLLQKKLNIVIFSYIC